MTTLLRRRAAAELAGVLTAVPLGLLVLSHLAGSPAAWMLFSDGDSLLFPLVSASLQTGQAQQWVLSSPLFIPEALVYLPIGALGLPVRVTLLLDGLVNWVVLYAVIRAAAGLLRNRPSVRVSLSVVALATISVLALCESSGDRNALDLAALLTTTTYYSGTVAAVIGSVALTGAALRTRRGTAPLVGLCAVALLSVVSNPLYIAWFLVPLLLVLALTSVSGAGWARVLAVAVIVLLVSGLGMFARVPFGPILVQDNAAKIRPDLATASLTYYSGLLTQRLQSVPGVIELSLVVVLLLIAGAGLIWSVRHRWVTGVVLTGTALLGPLCSIIGAIMLGTFAARYLEPVVFLSPLGLLALPRLIPEFGSRLARALSTISIPVRAGLLMLALTVSVFSALTLTFATRTSDPSLDCATSWVNNRPDYGAGQYWTIRAIKAYIEDPRRLIQTDQDGNPYVWLSNAADLRQHVVGYTITDSESAPLGPRFSDPATTTTCGRYTIQTYREPVELGVPHH